MRSAESWAGVVHPIARLSTDTVAELKRQIERIQRDALLEAAEIAERVANNGGSMEENYRTGIEIHDAILERSKEI